MVDEKKKDELRCEMCGKQKPDVSRRLDPYDYEILYKKTYIVVCDDCYDLRSDEI